MHDSVDAVKQPLQRTSILDSPEVFAYQLNGGLKTPQVTHTEVADIDNAHMVPTRKQLGNQDRAEIAGPTGDQDVHVRLASMSARESTT
jgi:hypothetical protein